MNRTLWIAMALSAAAWGAQAAGADPSTTGPGSSATSPSVERGDARLRQRGRAAMPGDMPRHGATGGMAGDDASPSSSTSGGIDDARLRSALDMCADHPREQRADCAHQAFEAQDERGMQRGMPRGPIHGVPSGR